MREHTLTLQFSTLPPIFKRKQHVLILVRNSAGHFLLGKKDHYPPGMSRLIGGGMDEGELPQVAAVRELQEETGITAPVLDLHEIAKITAEVSTSTEHHTFVTYVYLLDVGHQKLHPSDDLDEIVELNEDEAQQLLVTYQQLPTELHPILNFSWADYGQLYHFIHQLAFETAKTIPVA